MKLWVLAGLFTVAMIPLAQASETAIECGLETPQLLRDVTVASVDTQTPVANKGARPARAESANAAAPPANVAPRPAQPADQRRRGGSLRRIPDAMLIDGRGVL
jgi:hypothetical protein